MTVGLRRRGAARALGPILLGAALAGGIGGAAVWLGRDRLFGPAPDADDLARACLPALLDALAARGFEPAEVEFGAAPRLGRADGAGRSFGDSFTFRDGAAQVRVDGVLACVVARSGASVDVRVAAPPRRAA